MKTNLTHKLTLLACALLGTGSAWAQSQVNLYGRVNLSVERQKVGDVTRNVEQNNSSRWGLKGSEDLGGGLRAGFVLESGFSADTGAASANFFGRVSELDLSGGFGTLRLGNFFSEAYYATADYVSNHNHDTGTSSDALYAYLGRGANKVAYRAPEFAKGLSLEGSISLREAAADHNYDVAVNWDLGDLALGAGYEKAGTQNQFAVRAYYLLGPWRFGGYAQHDNNAFGTGSRTNVRLSGVYLFGLSELHLNAGAAGKTGDVANSSAKQYTVAYNYNLSKRTKVYTFYTKVNDGTAALYGGDFSSLAVGIRHNF